MMELMTRPQKHFSLLRTYLSANNMDTEFEKHEKKDLAVEFQLVVAYVRTRKGELYKLNTYTKKYMLLQFI